MFLLQISEQCVKPFVSSFKIQCLLYQPLEASRLCYYLQGLFVGSYVMFIFFRDLMAVNMFISPFDTLWYWTRIIKVRINEKISQLTLLHGLDPWLM